MATVSPTRPSRRVAARRNVIVEESDDERSVAVQQRQDHEDGDDFTPQVAQTPPRKNRTKTTEVSMPPEPVFPTKKTSPRKRKSAAAPKRGRISVASDSPTLPTPRPSVTPEMFQIHGAPLADITDFTVNEQGAPSSSHRDVLPVKSVDLILEKPMDIVVRSRALALPTAPEAVSPKARTVIKYLVLINFKSYAGRQEVGPFHASFSSVVGPNGSGKSNVIDSLLFVFGFRASKMRQGKISALIHNSAAFPNLDFCEVEVHFEEVMDLVSHSNLHRSQLTGFTSQMGLKK